MSLLDTLRRALSRRPARASDAALTPRERAALELAGYDDIGTRRRTATGQSDVVRPGSLDSA